MEGNVSDIENTQLIVIGVDAPVSELIKAFSRTQHTCIPVINNDGDCFGIASAIDVMNFLSEGQNPDEIKAWEICSHTFVTAEHDTTIVEAATLMIGKAIHHLVICEAKKPVGMISTLDLIRHVQKTYVEKGLGKSPFKFR